MNGVLIASGIEIGLGGLLFLFASGPALAAAFLAAIVPPGRRLISAVVVWGVGFLTQCVLMMADIMDSRSLGMALMPGLAGSIAAAIGMYIWARDNG